MLPFTVLTDVAASLPARVVNDVVRLVTVDRQARLVAVQVVGLPRRPEVGISALGTLYNDVQYTRKMNTTHLRTLQ